MRITSSLPIRSRWLALGGALLVCGWPSAAQASNFSGATGAGGGSGCVNNMADNGNHYVWYESLAAATSSALNSTRTGDYDPTDLNTYDEDILTTQTDVVAYDYDYESTICGLAWMNAPGGGGVFGAARCMIVVASNGKCDQFRLDFDNDFMGPESTTNEVMLACHEFGHSVGLLHTSDDYCMQQGRGHAPDLSAHDIAHINANY